MRLMAAIRTILTDIGGVVLCPDSRFWSKLTQEHGAPWDAEQRFYGAEGPWDECKVGKMTYQESLQAMADLFQVDLEVVTSLRKNLEWIVNQPMVRWLISRKREGYELIAVSNADTSLEDRLAQFHLADLFNAVVNSARVGAAKPDPAIYRYALACTTSNPQECVFIDDKPRNLPPAEALGIPGVLYESMPAFLDGIKAVWTSVS